MDDPPNWNLLVVFILGFFLDALGTLAVRTTTANRPLLASSANAMQTLVAIVAAILCIESRSLAAVACYVAGCFAGTYAVISLRKKDT